MQVRDLMTEDPFTLSVKDNLETLYDMMDEKHIRHVPIVDKNGDLLGLVTHRDLIRGALHSDAELPISEQRQMLRSITVETIMAPEVESIEANEDLLEAAQMMLENKFGCLPVVEGERLVGILTEADFVKHYIENN